MAVREPAPLSGDLDGTRRGYENFREMADLVRDDNRRRIFRVTLAAVGLRVLIERAVGHLLDAHSEGFGALLPPDAASFRVGQIVRVRFKLNQQVIDGRATVRNVCRRPDGRWRCGFAIVPSDDVLRHALRQAAIAAQRRRLQRIADRK